LDTYHVTPLSATLPFPLRFLRHASAGCRPPPAVFVPFSSHPPPTDVFLSISRPPFSSPFRVLSSTFLFHSALLLVFFVSTSNGHHDTVPCRQTSPLSSPFCVPVVNLRCGGGYIWGWDSGCGLVVWYEADKAYEGGGCDGWWWKTVVNKRKEEEVVWKRREERGKNGWKKEKKETRERGWRKKVGMDKITLNEINKKCHIWVVQEWYATLGGSCNIAL